MKEELIHDSKENMKDITDNKSKICSPIHERESEDKQDIYTPTGGNMNSNYVTPIAQNKNNRRMNNMANNAPQPSAHESRLSGVSPSGTYKENNDSKFYSSHTGEHVIKPFKMTTPSNTGNLSQNRSSFSSRINKSIEEFRDDSFDLMWLLRSIGYAYLKQIRYD